MTIDTFPDSIAISLWWGIHKWFNVPYRCSYFTMRISCATTTLWDASNMYKLDLISSHFNIHSGSISSTRYRDCHDVFFISMMVCVIFSFKNAFMHAQYIFEHHGEQVQHPCAFWISDNFRPLSQTFVHRKWVVARVSISAFLGIFLWAIAVTFFAIEADLSCDRMLVTVTAILNKLQNESVDIVHLCCVQTLKTWVFGFSGRQEW